MRRRDFMALTGLGAVATAAPFRLFAGETLAYREGLVRELLAKGEVVLIDFYTDWCTTCRAQGRAIRELRAENPAYDRAMKFVKVDWDVYSGAKLSRDLGIQRRSTLVVMKGNQVLGRIVADTRKAQIKALLDRGLKAAGTS